MIHTKINDIQVYAPTSRKELINFALEKKAILVAINAEKILNAPSEIIDLVNKNIGYPDGIGAVWALEQKGLKNVVKIPGCELWLDIISAHYKSKSFYLVGGSQEVIDQTTSKLLNEFENINIIGFRNGFIKSEEEKQKLFNDIKEKKPDVIFVAMGSPRQEQLMNEMNKFHRAVYQGLGGSFDVYIGRVERAPDWWVRNNLEWAYRSIKQPSRIKRQLKLFKFLLLLKLNKL